VGHRCDGRQLPLDGVEAPLDATLRRDDLLELRGVHLGGCARLGRLQAESATAAKKLQRKLGCDSDQLREILEEIGEARRGIKKVEEELGRVFRTDAFNFTR
jgi:hypothetical protein